MCNLYLCIMKNINNLSELKLRELFDLPQRCVVQITKGDREDGEKYNKFIKYVITNLPSPIDKKREDIIRKDNTYKTDKIFSHCVPNFGNGVNWVVRF